MGTSRVNFELEFAARVIVTGSEPLTAAERAQLAGWRDMIERLGGPNLALAPGSSPVRGVIRAAVPANLVPVRALPGRRALCACGIEIDLDARVQLPLHRRRCPFSFDPLPVGAVLCGSITRPHHSARRQEPLSCTRPRGHERDNRAPLRACMDGRLIARMSGRAYPTWSLAVATLPAEAPVFGGES